MVFPLFFASGMAGLIYEVCWVRLFGNVFGNTVHSAAIVTAAFMLGLGLGGRWAGRWADKQAAKARASSLLLRGYALAELFVGLFGLALAVGLPHLGGLSAMTSSYTQDAAGWNELSIGSYAIRYVVAALLVVPPSLLMGATLTLLVKVVLLTDLSNVGWSVGLLYGVNTAGAALGAFACDAWLIPHVGVLLTQVVAVALNGLVALAAFGLSSRARTTSAQEAPAHEPVSNEVTPESARLVRAACWSLALSGFAALGMEMVWFRFLGATLGAYRAVFSTVLTVLVSGIWLGALVAGALQRRFGRALEWFVLAQALLAFVSLALVAVFVPSGESSYGSIMKAAIVLVAAPSLLMGFSFPLVNAHVQDSLGSVGKRAGALYLANTLGSVAGSLTAGLVLAPHLGSQGSLGVFAACSALAPVALVWADRARFQRVFALSTGVAVVAVAGWFAVPDGLFLRRFLVGLPRDATTLAMKEGISEIVTVVDTGRLGRMLFTNGHPMSATTLGAQRYMRAFAHIPLLMLERPQRALVICFGVGNTIHATSLHDSLTKLDLADLSRNVLSHAGYFRDYNHDVLTDRRLSVFIQDGRQHLRVQPTNHYDLITLEPPPIAFAGISALYSREFYELARSRLTDTGILSQWLPVYQVPPETGLAMVRAFVEVFPNAVLLSGHGPELILMGSRAPELTLDLDAVSAKLASLPRVAEDLKRVKMGTLTEIAATFVADSQALADATAGVRPVTDDFPSMEYTFGQVAEEPITLFGRARAGIRRFCPKCFVGAGDPRVRGLDEQLALLETIYADREFRRQHPFRVDPARIDPRVVESSEYLKVLLGVSDDSAPGLGDARVAARADARRAFMDAFAIAQTGRLEDAAATFERGLALDPSDADARYNLAVLYASSGREEEAVVQAKRVIETRPTHAKARAMLCQLRGEACAK